MTETRRYLKKSAIVVTVLATAALLAGCDSDAKKAGENISTAADNFEVQRKIVGINGITGKYEFYVEGRCSLNDQGHQLEVICKHGANEYRKHMIGLSDNTFYVAEQLDPIDVSVYHTRIVIKPENIIPQLDLQGGKQ
jgi:hypothetical protein